MKIQSSLQRAGNILASGTAPIPSTISSSFGYSAELASDKLHQNPQPETYLCWFAEHGFS